MNEADRDISAVERNPEDRAATDSAALLSRFPAVRTLAASRRRRQIPVVHTLARTDCGAACLAMVLGYYGKSVRLDELREATGTDRDGVDALAILHAGQNYGLRGRGVRLEIDDLDYLSPGAILHWEFNHFVILERTRRDAVDVIDPAVGRRRVSMNDFRKSFTGVELTFEPSDNFLPSGKTLSGVWKYFRRVLEQRGVEGKPVARSVIVQLLRLALPLFTPVPVDRVVPRADYGLLGVLCAGMFAVAGFHFVAMLIRAHLLLHLRTHLDVQMMLGFLEHLVSLPFAFFQRRSAGDLMMRLSSNATMREMLTSTTMSALLDGALVAMYLVVLMVVHVPMGLLVLGLGAARIIIFVLARRSYRSLMARDLAAQARSEGYLVELLAGIETLKSLGAERRAVEHWSQLFVGQLNVSLQRGRLS